MASVSSLRYLAGSVGITTARADRTGGSMAPALTSSSAREPCPLFGTKCPEVRKLDKGKETGSGGAPASKSAKAVKPLLGRLSRRQSRRRRSICRPRLTCRPARWKSGKIVYLKMAELHPFHTFREHPYKVQDDKAMDDLVGTIKEHGIMTPPPSARKKTARAMRSSQATAAITVVHGPGWRKCPVSSAR